MAARRSKVSLRLRPASIRRRVRSVETSVELPEEEEEKEEDSDRKDAVADILKRFKKPPEASVGTPVETKV